MIILKIKSFITKFVKLFLVSFFLISLFGFFYVTKIYTTSPDSEISTVISNSMSTIYDSKGRNITTLTLTNNNSVEYSDLPDVFINALISAEDARFFEHSGVDFQRMLSALINNVTTNSTQGASTLTQQLIKNVFLDSSKTLDRKINEIIIALKLENKLSKEDILLAYANNIMFDGVTLGVNSASLKLFSKPINQVNLAESALLAGIVNAPTYYNPIKNPLRAKERMDTVLNLMYRHNYITATQLLDAKKFQISDLINISSPQESSYPYQSYLDIVYNEVLTLTGYNPLTTPLIIETYMDTELQTLVDTIQNNEDSMITFIDPKQQIAISVIDNSNGALIAASGGRNYSGQFLFNRATDMKNQPASTIKPLLSYALAIEYLDWNNNQLLADEPYTYPNSTTSVHNVDNEYMGEILISEALGYSRNTTALTTLEKVIQKVGLNTVINYLKEINLLDIEDEKFNLSYGLGAMYNGVSPTQLASAYSMLARGGSYTNAYTIKKITLQETNEVIYTHLQEEKQILSEETAFIMSEILKDIVDNNYYNLGMVKVPNVEIHAKTGTSSFDSNLLKKLNYPSNASKDIWLAGYSPDYTTVVWSGFDYPEKGKENYFKAGTDSRKYIPRNIFAKIMTYQSKKDKTIVKPSTLEGIKVVKGTNLLPDNYTPSSLTTLTYYKKGNIPTETISPKQLEDISNLDILQIGDTLNISFQNNLLDITNTNQSIYHKIYYSIYGNLEYVVELADENGVTNTYSSSNSTLSIKPPSEGLLSIKAYSRYSKAIETTSNIYETTYYLISFI